MTDMVTLPVEDVKALLDIATNSMDFGSGFWDHAECEAARKIAIALGIDPINVTPGSLAKDYPHPYKAREMIYGYYYPSDAQNRENFARDCPTGTIVGDWQDKCQHGVIYTDYHCDRCQQVEDWPAHTAL